jgi:hypothetical protein
MNHVFGSLLKPSLHCTLPILMKSVGYMEYSRGRRALGLMIACSAGSGGHDDHVDDRIAGRSILGVASFPSGVRKGDAHRRDRPMVWYAQQQISQEKAAEIAGLSRASFLDELFRRRVPACQVTLQELVKELERDSE